jgi:hypothetical protein
LTDVKAIESLKENLPIKINFMFCLVALLSAGLWILIRMDPHQNDKLDPEPDPYLH